MPKTSRPLSTRTSVGQSNTLGIEFQNNRYVSRTIRQIFDYTGGWGTYYGVGGFGTANQLGRSGLYRPHARGRSMDTETADVATYGLSVNPVGQFKFNNLPINDRDFINYLLGNMISGQGPENYVFPENGSVSERAAQGATFQKAIDMWYSTNKNAILSHNHQDLRSLKEGFKVDYTPKEQGIDLLQDGTPLTIPNFIGSAWATIDILPNDMIRITIFNVTSLTSGDGIKHFHTKEITRSVTRRPGQITPFGSISTTFSVTRKINYNQFQLPNKAAQDAIIQNMGLK